MNSFVTNRSRAILLIPFCYAFFSRMKGLRGFGFNAATLWIPGVIITAEILSNSGSSSLAAVIQYAMGYLVFICLYELGYVMNDTWGLRYDSTPRRRIEADIGPGFIAIFFSVRLVVVALLAGAGGYLLAVWFLALVSALAGTILLHNLLSREEFKLMSFLQMSLLRFCFPVFVACQGEVSPTIFIVALLLFTFPRFLTYQDSKGRLRLPERKSPYFGLGNCLCAGPLIILIVQFDPEAGFLYVWFYFLALWTTVFGWSLARGQKDHSR